MLEKSQWAVDEVKLRLKSTRTRLNINQLQSSCWGYIYLKSQSQKKKVGAHIGSESLYLPNVG